MDALVQALVDDPDDLDSALVYADWLQREGDPRGELIALQIAAERTGDAVAADAFLAAHQAAFLGDELAVAVAFSRDNRWGSRARTGGLELTWRRGFITRAWIGRQPDASWDEARAVLATLLRHPSAALLRELVLDVPIFGRDVHFTQVHELLVETPVPPPLRRLQIGDFVDREVNDAPYPDRDISAVLLGDLAPLWPRYPRLEEVELQGNHLELGTLELPALRSFELCSSACSDEHLAAIRTATWPELRRLVLWLGDGEYGGENTTAAIDALLRTPMPNLVELGIMNTEHADHVAHVLARSPLAAQLEILDLSMGILSGAGARSLTRAAFPRLAELRVQRNYLAAGAIAELGRTFPTVHAGAQRDEVRGERYVGVSE